MKIDLLLLASTLAVVALGTESSNVVQEFSEVEVLAHRHFKKLLGFVGDAIQGKHAQAFIVDSFKGYDTSKMKRWSYVNKFVFTNCAKPEDEQVVVESVSLKPDPLKLPGNVTGGGSVTIKTPFGSPLKMALEIYYKVLGAWIKVPCVEDVGSCTYPDFCKMLKVKECPPEITKVGLKCECPFPAGNFTVSSATLAIDAKLPISGDIKVQAEASMNGKFLTCAQIELTIA